MQSCAKNGQDSTKCHRISSPAVKYLWLAVKSICKWSAGYAIWRIKKNQDTDSEYERSRSLWIGIPMRAMISRPMMYLPFVVQRNFPAGLIIHTILLNAVCTVNNWCFYIQQVPNAIQISKKPTLSTSVVWNLRSEQASGSEIGWCSQC